MPLRATALRLSQAAPVRARPSIVGRVTPNDDSPLPVGKLPPELLAELLGQATTSDPSVIVGARVGEDAAVIDTGGDEYTIVSSDPITFASEDMGWYAVHVNANDIAATGGTPRWLVATVLLPEGASPRLPQDIMRQMLGACAEIDVTLIGGHTEVTRGLDRPIVVGAMLGQVRKGREVLSSGMRTGDSIILTKGIGIEGTAILAREWRDELLAAGVSPDMIARASGFLRDPGISIVPDASIAIRFATVHAMHDPTEGGVATALHEMADASGVGVEIGESAIHEMILPETAEICVAVGAHVDDVQPLGLIGSGALIAAVAPEDADKVVGALRRAGIRASVIGRATPRHEGARVLDSTPDGAISTHLLPRYDQDELARALGG